MEYVWIGEEGQGRHVIIGTTKGSNHWFLLTPDGKGGIRTYHLGDQKPDKKKIQEQMANGGYSYLFGATDDPKDFFRSANYDGRKGKLVTKVGDAEIWTHQLESRGSGKWAAVLHRPGKEPVRFRTFDKPPTEGDFKEGTEARKALDRILGVSTAPVQKKGSRVQIEGIGDSEVWVEERKVGRSGKSQWVATVYVPGHEPTAFWRFDAKPGTGHFAPDKPARKELEEKIEELRKASGASSTPQGARQGSGTPVVTPTSLVKQQYVGTIGDERAMVLVGQLRGDDKWFVVTPKGGGGFNSYLLKDVKLTNGQLSDETKARIRKMIEGGAFSQVWGGGESKPMSNPYRA